MDAVLVGAVIGLVIGCALALVPVGIAYARRHPERRTIAALTPGAFLSFILWAALLAWAVGGQRNDSVIGKYADRLKSSGWLVPLALALVAGGIGITWLTFNR